MASNHKRALMSQTGDGNWVGLDTQGTPVGFNVLDATGSGVDGAGDPDPAAFRYFPKGANAITPPAAGQQIGGTYVASDMGADYIGWNSKTNWMIQVKNTHGSGTGRIQVSGVRPNGVEEPLITIISLASGVSVTEGGVGGDEIYGPFSYFIFYATANAGTLECFVSAWNFGNIWDNQV